MMKRFFTLGVAAAACCIAIASPLIAQSRSDDARFRAAQDRFNNELSIFRTEFDRYQQATGRGLRGGYGDRRYDDQQGYSGQSSRNFDDRDEGGYDPSRYYRESPNYQERALSSSDRVYRGSDGRYYCKRNDGTTGLIIGAAGGGILGNVIDGGHSRTVGTLIGAAVGAMAGRSVEQSNAQVRCR